MKLELEKWEGSRFLKNKVNQIFMVEMSLPVGQSEVRPTFSTRARFCITIFKKRFIFHRYEWCACMFVCTCVPGALGGLRPPGSEIIIDCKPPYWFWEANLSSL